MADFKGSATGITLEEHTELMKTRTRPVTDEPIRLRQQRVQYPTTESLLDRYVKAEDSE